MAEMTKYVMARTERARDKKEIAGLDRKAREYEDWLLDNTESPDFFKILSKYTDVLFKLAQKKEKAETLKSGPRTIETTSLPARTSRHMRIN
jgi:hypothetical protein